MTGDVGDEARLRAQIRELEHAREQWASEREKLEQAREQLESEREELQRRAAAAVAAAQERSYWSDALKLDPAAWFASPGGSRVLRAAVAARRQVGTARRAARHASWPLVLAWRRMVGKLRAMRSGSG